jgi:CubicO group peptidase (beta-lactamase class C family)
VPSAALRDRDAEWKEKQIAGQPENDMLQVPQNGSLVHYANWEWSQTPADQGKGWNENTRMHVASVSKFLTAVGLIKLLDTKGISYDAKIIDYLPTYWSKGKNTRTYLKIA